MKLFEIPMVVTSLVGLCFLTGLNTPPARADFTFGESVNVGPPINTSSSEDYSMCISSDGLSLYFSSNRAGGHGNQDLYMTTRPTKSDPWGPVVNLGATVNSPGSELGPSISADGLSLYFESNRAGGMGSYDLWVTIRASVSDPWSEPVNLGGIVNSISGDIHASISADGLSLFFGSGRERAGTLYGGNCYIYVTTRPTTDAPWDAPVKLGPTVNFGLEYDCDWPSISADGRTLFFSSNRPGGFGLGDLWVTTRATQDDEWGAAVNLGPTVNDTSWETWPHLSPDGQMLYFSATRPGGFGGTAGDIWQSSILPVVDFNADGMVDAQDEALLVEHLGQDDPRYDIGPFAWGDGVVDDNDLAVLTQYMGKEWGDPTLRAHWALDETEGIIASDSAGGHDATALGIPVWQPEGGQIKGALELDGVTFLKAPFVLSPAEGPFSILAWIKGGAPGQVILSQVGGANWLATDAIGALMTELKGLGRSDKALASAAIITDGNWHRITFTWDGANRRLYMDGVPVAEDTQDSLAESTGDLLLGVGKTLAPGTFWSGLIDDVRIYSRAVQP